MNARDGTFWRVNIRDAINDHGGVADLQDIYSWFEAKDYLGEGDLRITEDGRPAYQWTVRGVISWMCDVGELEWVSRGRYRIRTDYAT